MDLVCFRCAASAENDEVGIAIHRLNDLMDNILTKVNATEFKAYLSGKTNYRKTIYPEYKANRTGPKPRHLDDIRSFAELEWNAIYSDENLEADDMLGIEQDKSGNNTVICTLDKDLLQIPGKHFSWEIRGKNWERPDTWFTQTELEGNRLFYEQAIKGDKTDNIRGIANMGKVKASRAIAHCVSEKEMFDIVRQLYSNDEEFIMNASCVWIMRERNKFFKERFEELASI